MQQLKRLWAAWKRIARAIGNIQARILLTLIYAVLVLPFGLAVRFFSDSMNIKRRPVKWFDYPEVAKDLEQARHQG
jgi:hypothetical protein